MTKRGMARLAATTAIVAATPGSRTAAQTVIPTRYIADRFFAAPVSQQGDTIVLLMDTGGGGVFVIKPVLERLGITPKFVSVEEGDSVFVGGKFPRFKAGLSIPPALGNPPDQIAGFGVKPVAFFDGAVGMVGHNWFAGRVWVLDYPRHQASYYETPPAPKPFGPHTIPMTLKRPLTRDDPRIQVIVAGDTVDMLLDTGATSMLSPQAIGIVGPGPAIRASAFVASRLFDAWHTKHPDWRVVPGGEANMHADLIGVPSVSIAGYDVGPIWFAKRADQVYDGMMKALMDKPILASIGGTAFRQFKLTLDYVNQRVTFEKP
jgi:hypothetical protein